MWPLGTNEINYLHFPLSFLPCVATAGEWLSGVWWAAHYPVAKFVLRSNFQGHMGMWWMADFFLSWLIRILVLWKSMLYRSMNITAASPTMFSAEHRFSGVLWIYLKTPMYMVLYWFHGKKPTDWLRPYLLRGVTIPPPAYFRIDSSGFASHIVHMLYDNLWWQALLWLALNNGGMEENRTAGWQ